MPDLFLEWGADLLLTSNGSVQFAVGWDHVRQRIVRNMITNPAQTLPDGSTTPPDYVFEPTFGIGMGSLVDQNPTKQFLRDLNRRITAAVLADVAVDPGLVPSVLIQQPTPSTYEVFVTATLLNGQLGKIQVGLAP